MIDLIRTLYRNKVQELKNDLNRKQVEAKVLEEASDLVVDRPDTTAGWTRRYQVNDWEKGHIQANQLEVVRKAREFDRWDAHAHGILNTMVFYIMGKGLSLQPKSRDPLIWYIWREFFTAKRNKMNLKQFEVVRRVFRDGEIFLRLFTKDENGQETGKTTVRFLDPLLIRHPTEGTGKVDDEPNESIKNGVVTDPEDVETVKAYQLMDRVDRTSFETIPEEEVIHVKINADSDQKRGEPGIQTLLKYFRHYEQWLDNRILLNKMRTAIVMIKKVEGTPTEVANMAATLPLATRQVANETKRKNFRGGTVITEGPGVTYRMESPNINASDVKEDGRNIILAMAAGMNTPEYIFGDASNANYASTMIAESPFVKMIQYFQVFFEAFWQELFERVVRNAVKAGMLEAPNDDQFVAQLKKIRTLAEDAGPEDPQDDGPEGADKSKPELSPRDKALKELMPDGKMETPTEIFFGIDIAWPEIIHRDMDKQVGALAMARQNGWVSDATASGALGFEYGEEVRKQRQIEEDAQIEDNPLLGSGGQGDDGDMSDELNGVLSQLSDDDRKTIMNSKDPKEIKGIMDKYNKAPANANANGNGEEE
jgi:lambda family portal protein